MKGCPSALVNLVDGADVGMIQGRGGFGFALKTAECLRVFGYVVGQELQSHKAPEPHILGLVHDAHSAAAELLDDAVVRDGLANHWRESYFRETGKSMKAVALDRLVAANESKVRGGFLLSREQKNSALRSCISIRTALSVHDGSRLDAGRDFQPGNLSPRQNCSARRSN